MSMSTSLANSVSVRMAPISRLLKPPVRAIVEWKKAASSLAGAGRVPSVAGLVNSVGRTTTVPNNNSALVRITVIRVITDQRLGRRQDRASSITTGYPSPPTMTAAAMVRHTTGSAT
jgi:hypothetical protein